jgi:hypothetical protein
MKCASEFLDFGFLDCEFLDGSFWIANFGMKNSWIKSNTVRGSLRAGMLAALCMALAVSAAAQADFTVSFTSAGLFPDAVDPGGNSGGVLEIQPGTTFTGTVSLTCQVTPAPPNGNQGCTVSPTTVTPPSSASVTIATLVPTGGDWASGGYTITITGTASTGSAQAPAQRLTVLSEAPSFTITLGTVITPTSVPAGSSGTGTIVVNPLAGYNGNVTLTCSSVSPVVVSPPVCAFTYPNGAASLPVVGSPATATLMINTIGPLTPLPTTRVAGRRHFFYALWLPLPMFLLAGIATGRRRWRAWGMLCLFVICALILLLPACGTTTTPQAITSSSLITPNNTYTFTITGVDSTGMSASNSSSGPGSTVTLTVTSATNP